MKQNFLKYRCFNILCVCVCVGVCVCEQAAVGDLAKFGKICKIKAFVPFRSAQDALENINSISEGLVHPLLKDFLEANFPKVLVFSFSCMNRVLWKCERQTSQTTSPNPKSQRDY